MMSQKNEVLQFNTQVLQTKEELMLALDEGKIKSSLYNALDDDEKMFVKLVVFGGHPGHKAMKQINPKLSDHYAAATRMSLRPQVIDVMEELTEKRNKYWTMSIMNSRDFALRKLEYIMKTTEDEALAATCADRIIKHAMDSIKGDRKEQDAPGFNMVITVAPDLKQPTQEVVTVDYSEIVHKNYKS
jgi:hypothetical protein